MKITFAKMKCFTDEHTVEVFLDGDSQGHLYREIMREGESSWAPDEDLRDNAPALYESGWEALSEAKRDVKSALAG